ncbi:gamma-glutamyltransferase [Pelagibius sp. Alg239-R121]|uniref:gamma-glutamyltransferase n=1 Tax=Pelagibius sp. Alg239-R121 TaxID=2993448 RepID=UPI0024A63A15|nr:gamma-glutamyltransferase [Pelagibius sp. Alg239-R121]
MRDFQAGGRSAAFGETGMVATSHPEASLAALEQLRAGGNAVDAALAAVSTLCVVEPHMTGVGGDCFVLYCPASGPKANQVIALNGSGRAPSAMTSDALLAQGITEIDYQSAHAVTVPGAIDAWCKLHETYGSRPLDTIFARAIGLGENGYRVLPRIALDWADNVERLMKDANATATFLPGGTAPLAGDRHAQPALAATLRGIAAKGRSAFYEGAVAEDIVDTLRGLGGFHRLEDFVNQTSEFVEPIKTAYRGYEVYECPPNGQGLIALMILNQLSGLGFDGELSELDRVHLLAEATKLGYASRDCFLADPAKVDVPVEQLLSEAYADKLRQQIKTDSALDTPDTGLPEHKDTVYLTVVDRDGNAISFINSIFEAFGSTRLAPKSGVMLHNRGASFRVSNDHPNGIAPGKRPLHTIIPGMVMREGRAVMPFGVMGGHYQATGHANFLSRVFDEGVNVQQALEWPRSFASDGALKIEVGYDDSVYQGLAARGHQVVWADRAIGGGQAIWIDHARGVLIGGSDPRKDGCALGL